MSRNKNWSEDEVILLLDLYFDLKDTKYTKNHPAILGLSNLLRSKCNDNASSTYRNNTGIFMKLQNIRAIESKGQDGLKNCSNMDKKIWNVYSGNINVLKEKAEQIRLKYKCFEYKS